MIECLRSISIKLKLCPLSNFVISGCFTYFFLIVGRLNCVPRAVVRGENARNELKFVVKRWRAACFLQKHVKRWIAQRILDQHQRAAVTLQSGGVNFSGISISYFYGLDRYSLDFIIIPCCSSSWEHG